MLARIHRRVRQGHQGPSDRMSKRDRSKSNRRFETEVLGDGHLYGMKISSSLIKKAKNDVNRVFPATAPRQPTQSLLTQKKWQQKLSHPRRWLVHSQAARVCQAASHRLCCNHPTAKILQDSPAHHHLLKNRKLWINNHCWIRRRRVLRALDPGSGCVSLGN